MPRSRRFVQLDVFADRPGAGNPLAVVMDAEDFDTDAMQRFAHWTNLSETTFILPASDPAASYRVRIFTPRQELPFAGHPSVGSAHAAIDAGIATPVDGALVQQCAAGLLPMRVEGDGLQRWIFVRAPRAHLVRRDLPDGWMSVIQGLASGALPPVLMDNGPRWWLGELRNEAELRMMTPNLDAISKLTQATGAVGLALFARVESGEHQLVVRAFCPADGIPEDPVTGSANAAIGAWLQINGAPCPGSYSASQGREMGRDGVVRVRIDDSGEVWIGGQTQTVIDGTLDW